MRKLIVVFLLSFLFMNHAAFAEEAGSTQAARLVGWWEEYSPSSNLVRFAKDGTMKLMLKKGEIGDLHSLDGTWKLSGNAIVHIAFSVNGKTIEKNARLSFENGEMIMTDTDGTKTRHRRHSGVLPKEYAW